MASNRSTVRSGISPGADPEAPKGERSEPAGAGGSAPGGRGGEAWPPDPEVPAKARRRRFTAEYKLRILEEADQRVKHGQLGALLRREGLYSSHIQKWRAQRDAGALAGLSRKRGRKPTRRHDAVAVENAQLRRETARLQKRLEQAELIIDIQKKVAAMLGIPLSRPESGEDA